MKRFVEEFFLYSSQLVVFFIIMLFLTPSAADVLGALPLGIVSAFLVIQIFLLVGQGHNPILRFLFSFISPASYALVRVIGGDFAPWDMANVFLWTAALYVGLFQALAIAARTRWLKRAMETLLAIGAVLVFVFFYFYLDRRLAVASLLKQGLLDKEGYEAALDIRAFAPAFLRFIQSPQNAFFVYGSTTFGLMMLASKVESLSLRSRIARLFGEAKLQGPSPNPEVSMAQQVEVTVLSADIWDFSLLTDKLSAKGAVDILNRYYALWETLAEKYRGRVVDLTGDSVVIAFGVPASAGQQPSPADAKDAAERAIACAQDFQAELPGLRGDLAAASMPPLGTVGVGIHSGRVIAGDLGLKESRQLGIFGDAVSVAARLDSLCKEFTQEILISQPVFRQLSLETQSRLQRLGEVLLRNSTQPVPVYSPK